MQKKDQKRVHFLPVRGQVKLHSFTLIELLVVIAIIAILAAILLPALNSARARGRLAACVNNLKQIGASMAMYEQDFDHIPPDGVASGSDISWYPNVSWYSLMFSTPGSGNSWKPANGGWGVLFCPADTRLGGGIVIEHKLSYSSNIWAMGSFQDGESRTAKQNTGLNTPDGKSSRLLKSPSHIVTVFDATREHLRADAVSLSPVWLPEQTKALTPADVEHANYCHRNGSNYLMWDGHVEFLDRLLINRFAYKYLYNNEEI